MDAELLESIRNIAVYVLLYLVMFAGVVIIPLGVPGEFLIPLGVGIFMIFMGTGIIGWQVLLVTLALAVLAEVLEGIAGFAGARKAKGSIRSAIGAIAGGILGGIAGSVVAPVIGSLIGAFLGTFAGAYIVEFYLTKHSGNSMKVAKAALVGRIVGTAVKVSLALVMILVVTFAIIFD